MYIYILWTYQIKSSLDIFLTQCQSDSAESMLMQHCSTTYASVSLAVSSLQWISENQNYWVTTKKHLWDVTIFVHWLWLFLPFPRLWHFGPHLLHVLKNHVAMPVHKLSTVSSKHNFWLHLLLARLRPRHQTEIVNGAHPGDRAHVAYTRAIYEHRCFPRKETKYLYNAFQMTSQKSIKSEWVWLSRLLQPPWNPGLPFGLFRFFNTKNAPKYQIFLTTQMEHDQSSYFRRGPDDFRRGPAPWWRGRPPPNGPVLLAHVCRRL